MKRILGSVLALLFAVPAFAQVTMIQGQATTVNIKLTSKTDGSNITGATITGITFVIAKHTDTLSSTVTTWTATTSGGGTHDCIEKSGSVGLYNCEIPVADVSALGHFEICASYTGAYTDCKTYEVVAAAWC